MMRIPALCLLAALALAGCDDDPDKRTTPQESRVTAKAVADVDAAMADARKARPLPAAAAPAATAEPSADTTSDAEK
ncbi:hypothetical protein [Sandarakinorhabdus sp. DWP1-3-1]|uniref:hypothetical protein n=1 Tax=Sandarakinorhabdus sp. DWP1-3-1 TaxID=2804627 RepID=UPI003CEC1568